MADNLKGIPFSNDDEGLDLPTLAKSLVVETYNQVALPVAVPPTTSMSITEVYVVWFCYILGGWKALCSTSRPDGQYYEVTHKKETDGSDGPAQTFVDLYVKVDQVVFDG